MDRYRRLRNMPQAKRLQEAEHLLAHPEELAKELAISVESFSTYDNAGEHFYDEAVRPKREAAGGFRRTNDVVIPLEKGGTVTPVDSPNRLRTEDPRLGDVPPEALAFDYVDRELLIQRTTSPAQWEDGRPNRGGLRLDILLATTEEPPDAGRGRAEAAARHGPVLRVDPGARVRRSSCDAKPVPADAQPPPARGVPGAQREA